MARDLTTRIGLLEHRVESIRAALAETALRDDVRLLLTEHLTVAEDALRIGRNVLPVDGSVADTARPQPGPDSLL